MSAPAESPPDEAWERFVRLPAAIALPVHIAALFDGAIDEVAAGRLGRHPRFASRLSALLKRKFSLGDPERPSEAADRTIALMPEDRLSGIARRAGAVYWAGAVAQEVRAERVAALKEAIGEDAYTAALAHRGEAVATEAPPDPQRLAELIEQDGRRCLSAWLAIQSDSVAARVRLRFADEFELAEPGEALREAGPRIMRLLAA